MNKIRSEIKEYIENNILPEYQKNEVGHNKDHIDYVIRRSFEIVKNNNLDVNHDMVYVIAAYHDIGHHIDHKTHEIISANMLAEDKKLLDFFTPEEIKIMSEAVADHRASSKSDPRSIYGRIVSTADRNNTVKQCFKRSYTYGKKHMSGATEDEIYENAYNTLNKKFGENGYAKFFFEDAEYDKFLKEIRELLKDKNKFRKAQEEYINELKKNNEI